MKSYYDGRMNPEELAQLECHPTVPDFLAWIENKWGDLPALNDLSTRLSYHQMCHAIGCKRALLTSLGLQKGNHVAIQDTNSIHALMMFLAVATQGLVCVVLPAQMSPDVVARCCEKFDIKVLAAGASFERQLKAQTLPCPVIDITNAATIASPMVEVEKRAPAAILFTGGTTGLPKGAVLSHGALIRGAYLTVNIPGHQLGCHRYVQLLPNSHVLGLVCGTLTALYKGAEWYTAPSVKEAIAIIPRVNPSILVAVPGICEILINLVKTYGRQFIGNQLRYINIGGASMPPQLVKDFHELGITPIIGYGLTEVACACTANNETEAYPTSVGKLFVGEEGRLVDGELWIRGDNVFSGYYDEPELTAQVLTPDGWLRTGDLARFDDQGNIFIEGRCKNIIVLPNGENVSPESVEAPFYQCEQLRDCLVRESTMGGHPVLAIEILPRMEHFANTPWDEVEHFFKELAAEVNATLPSTHRVAQVIVRKEDFPRTGAMKVMRHQHP